MILTTNQIPRSRTLRIKALLPVLVLGSSSANLRREEVLGLFTDGVMFAFTMAADEYREARYYSEREGFRVAAKKVLETWNDPSLLSAAKDLHSRARGHIGAEDNAGIILVKFQSELSADHQS